MDHVSLPGGGSPQQGCRVPGQLRGRTVGDRAPLYGCQQPTGRDISGRGSYTSPGTGYNRSRQLIYVRNMYSCTLK